MTYLLVTDLDNTLVGDDTATQALNQRIQAEREQFCFVYATGRSYDSTQELIAQKQLLAPDYLIAGVGSEIYQNDIQDRTWAEYLSQNWDRSAIASLTQEFSELKLQSPKEQNPWKLSFLLDPTSDTSATIDALQEKLKKAGLAAQIVFSNNRDVDILPENSNKGKAIAYLQKRLEIKSEAILVCGDSGNDISMFEQQVCGVIVANAQPELLSWYQKYGHKNHYLARSGFAEGIVEGIKFFWGL